MKVYVVLGLYGGVPNDVEVYVDRESAQRRGQELARDYELLKPPWDWRSDDGRWEPEIGATRSWTHHWYNDEHDVVVASCELEKAPSHVPVQ